MSLLSILHAQNPIQVQKDQQKEITGMNDSRPAAIPVLSPEGAEKANDEAIKEWKKDIIEQVFLVLRFSIVLIPLLVWFLLVYKGILGEPDAAKSEKAANE